MPVDSAPMVRDPGLKTFDLVVAGVLALVALGIVGYSTFLLIRTPPLSWAFVVAFGLAVILCAAYRIDLGRRSGMPMMGIVVPLLLIAQPGADPFRLVGIWTAALFIAQLLHTRNAVVAGYISGLGALAALAYVEIFDLMRDSGVPFPIDLLVATAGYLLVILGVDFIRQRGRWGLDHEFGFSGLIPRRIVLVFGLLWGLGSVLYFLDRTVVPAMANDPAIEQSPMLVLVVAAIIFAVAMSAQVGEVQRRLSAVVSAATSLPWRTLAEAEERVTGATRLSIQADAVAMSPDPATGTDIGAAVELPGGGLRYLVATRGVSSSPFTEDDERVLGALAHLATDTLRARADVETLQRSVDTDALTGLPNYRAFQAALAESNAVRAGDDAIAVLFIDLDDFKNLNDGRGHHVGDKMLKLVGARLAEAVGDSGFAARVGGDEFVVILQELSSLDEARERTDALVDAVSRVETVDGDTLAPVVSIGVAYSPSKERDPAQLVIDADQSMLALKRSRHGERQRTSGFDVAASRSNPVTDAVIAAVQDGALEVAYQPIVEVATGTIWAFEALVRLTDPVLGPIPPITIIRKVKTLGLLDELTVQVTEKAMQAAMQFRATNAGVTCMTVNVDLPQIAENRLGAFLRGLPDRFPELRICIELNERSLRLASDALRAQAQVLRDSGVLIALDDYGSESSSVAAIATFPLDIIKIDRNLILDLADVRQREIVRSIQSYSDAVGFRVVVEGVEDQTSLTILRELGVTDVQGFLYGRPDTLTGLEKRLLATGSIAVIA